MQKKAVECVRLVGAVGIEPTTFGLKGRCSTTELRPYAFQFTKFITSLFAATISRLSDRCRFAKIFPPDTPEDRVVERALNACIASSIMWASARPIEREMREPGMDPRSTVFHAQP